MINYMMRLKLSRISTLLILAILTIGCTTTTAIKLDTTWCDRYPTIKEASPSRNDTEGTKKFSLTYITLRKKDCDT